MPLKKKQKPSKPQTQQKPAKKAEKSCEICGRDNRDDRRLGPLITVEKSSITAHYKCVLFCPKTLKRGEYGVDGIAGMTADFIRSKANVSNRWYIFIPSKYSDFRFIFMALIRIIIFISFILYRFALTVSAAERAQAAVRMSERTWHQNFVIGSTT